MDEDNNTENKDDLTTIEFKARPYQLELFDKCMHRNSIICLQTGTGKTFIAIMLINELADEIRKPYNEDGKRTIFVVNNVPLVHQQADSIRRHTDLVVGDFFGDKCIDNKILDHWDISIWKVIFETTQVLVMTGKILEDILNHVFISFEQINLLIVDECHHAKGGHPFKQIFNAYKDAIIDNPNITTRILGLTASIVNSKCSLDKFIQGVNELEDTTTARVLTSSLIHNGDKRFIKKPMINLVLYGRETNSTCNQICADVDEIRSQFNLLEDKFKRLTALIKDNNANGISSDELNVTDDTYEANSNKNYFIQYKRLFLNLNDSLNELGLFTLYETLKRMQHLANDGGIELTTSKTEHEIELIKIIKEYFYLMVLNRQQILILNENNFLQLISEKVKCLIDILLKLNMNSKMFHAIIFVAKRETAYYLDYLFKKLSSFSVFDGKFKNLKTCYISGHESMTTKIQTEILKKFRKREINILIATNIIEEGVDIPACNTVIRFDAPETFRSYIQSKGRARAEKSEYYIMVEQKAYDLKFKDELKQFIDIENFIEKDMGSKLKKQKSSNAPNCLSGCTYNSLNVMEEYVGDDEEEDEEEAERDFIQNEVEHMAKYEKGNAKVTPVMAISLVQRYCALMENDGVTLYPKWNIMEIKSISPIPSFYCTLRLPPTAVVHEEVKGDVMKRKKLAKMSAALKMIELLDKAGELDSHLIPIPKESWGKLHLDFDIEKEDEEHKANGFKHKIGTSKTKRKYDLLISDGLKNGHPTENAALHLYLIDIESAIEESKDDNGNSGFVDFVCKNVHIGYLTSRKLENIQEFSIKKSHLHLKINITESKTREICLTQDQLERLKQIQEIIFNSVLSLNLSFDFVTSQYGGLVVFLNAQHEIDFEKTLNDLELREGSLVRIECLSQNSVYMVKKVDRELTPLSKFPKDLFATYKEYYETKFNIQISNLDQPLVELKHLVRHTNFISDQIKLEKLDSKTMWYIAEQLTVLPITFDEFNKLRLIPSVLYRLNSLFNASQLKAMIEIPSNWIGYVNDEQATWESSIRYNKAKQDGDKVPDGLFEIDETQVVKDDDTADEVIEEDNESENEDTNDGIDENLADVTEVPPFSISETQNEENRTLPNVFEILQCLTLRHVKDSFDLERYEILGDCFLKLNISLYIYCKFDKTNEGNMSYLKSQRVSNRYLYKLAVKRNLHNYINATLFIPKENWLAPNALTPPPQFIADKSLADCIEALIGLYLIKCGTIGARKLMNWFEFIVSKEYGVADFNEAYELPDPLIASLSSEDDAAWKLTLKRRFENFEKSIGYTFTNPYYLQQAFTHPSYTSNRQTCSYQRLEFIGDAVLDILVTQYLFNQNKEYSPGELTDLRQALVNNKFFSYLCVKHDFQKYFSSFESEETFNKIKNYLQIRKNYSPRNAYCSTIQDFEEGEITLDDYDSPKALADLFESVAGAIFLDSGCSLDTVWKVYYKMLAPYFVAFIKNPPRSPIAVLLHLEPNCKFQCICYKDRDYVEIQIQNGDDVFVARSSTKNKARIKACKLALKKYCKDKDALFF